MYKGIFAYDGKVFDAVQVEFKDYGLVTFADEELIPHLINTNPTDGMYKDELAERIDNEIFGYVQKNKLKWSEKDFLDYVNANFG